MTKTKFTTLLILLLLAGPAAAQDSFLCREQTTTILDLTPGSLPYANGTSLTNEFSAGGFVFAADAGQQNMIQQGTFYNLNRLDFSSSRKPVIRVSATFGDQNVQRQTMTLTAYDTNGYVVDRATQRDPALDPGGFWYPVPDRFILTVSSCRGIAYVMAGPSPIGAERVERITITTGQILEDRKP